jgi:type VI secretion system Hcp family effector
MAKSLISTVGKPTHFADVHMRGYNSVLIIDGIEGFSQYAEKAIDIVQFEWAIGTESTQQTKGHSAGTSRVAFDGVKVRKAIDKATPLLFKSVAEHSLIKHVAIFLYRDPSAGGKEAEHYMTISLGDVYVTRQVLVDPEGGDAGGTPYEDVTFTANSIEVNHVLAKKVASILLTQGV